MNIELHIERLILDGLQVEPRDRSPLLAAVQVELTRLLAAGGLRSELLSGGALRSIGAGEIQVTNQIDPLQLGNQIAQAVHGGVGVENAGQHRENAASSISSESLG